eukprot:GHVS01058654.1.p2 GENE.GHVS01058654.1~~GHVS01058654.1.p2  ORF type:complete len:123 (+),score=4.10 GHVS01058654.1:261-629(+)
MGIITRSLWCLVMVMVVATVTEGLPCCTSCKSGDLRCFMNCDPNCIDSDKCVTAGENVYAAACSELCTTSARLGRIFVPEPTCRVICSSTGVVLCQKGQCLDKGCTQPKMMECINSVTSKCG